MAEKIGTLNTVDAFLEAQAGKSVPADMMQFLSNAPDVDPVPGDELNN